MYAIIVVASMLKSFSLEHASNDLIQISNDLIQIWTKRLKFSPQ